MTRSLSAENYAALQARRLIARDFIWFVVRDPDSGDPVYDGQWSDVGQITCDVIDPDTGGAQERTFYGSGTLISVSAIQLTSDVTVQSVTVTLSQVASRVNELIRQYDCKQGQVQIFRGMFDPDSREIVGPAIPRFVGFIDHIEITTPKEGEEGAAVLTCVSHTQEFTRTNTDTRSDASQKLRSATDDFFADAATIGDVEFFWGKSSGTASSEK